MLKFEKNTIDSHIHIYDWYNKNGVDYRKLLDDIQKNLGLKGICVAALADRLYGGVDINIMSAIYKLHNPNAYAFANNFLPVYPACPPFEAGLDSLTQYKEFMDIGFDGIKILYKPDIQKDIKLLINDDYYEPFFAQAEKDKTNIMWHVADPEYCWNKDYMGPWSYRDGTYPTFKNMRNETFDVLEKHPKLNVTFAHFLFMSERPEVLEYIFKTYENVRVDITPHPSMYKIYLENYDFYREFFEKHSDRFVFGTDAEIPLNDKCELQIGSVYNAFVTDKEINVCGTDTKGLKLSDGTCEKLLYSNFKNACGDRPRPINKNALKAYIEKYAKYIIKESNLKPILEYAEKL